MKKNILLLLFSGMALVSCENELNLNPQGVLTTNVINVNETWVNQQLISAYATLDGQPGNWMSPPSNWVLSDVASDDFYKGSSLDDQSQITEVERYAINTTNSYLTVKWKAIYEGVSRCNQTLRSIELALSNGVPEEKLTPLRAEARFLRAHYHFEAKKIWKNVPFISETTTEAVSNQIDVSPFIEADLKYAIANLPTSQADAGRATSWVAKSYLAKLYMFDKDFTNAKPLLDDVINNGPYKLVDNFHDNFDAAKDNNSESVFAVQNSVNDGGNGYSNGNFGNILNHPYGGSDIPGGGCCGFFQASQNLVNAYQTDTNGLPLLEAFNDTDVKNDEGLSSSDPFTPYTGTLDPRLDWTVGRRGIDFLGWGEMPGSDWIRDQASAGPYVSKKGDVLKSQNGILSSTADYSFNAINTLLIRYADILLWRAEIFAEEGQLNQAMDLVNQIRRRAANPAGFVKDAFGLPAANYFIKEYVSFPNKDYALKAVRFERRLELASEGHRFFDLVRWGIAEPVLNKYLDVESTKRVYLKGAKFVAGKNDYYPIPLDAINTSRGVLKQNPGY